MAGMTHDMADMAHIARGSKGSAVRDVQARLRSLGYDLGDEIIQGTFGPLTARAVGAFREYAGLTPGEDVGNDTWAALVDATFIFGDRLLYLRMPHFHGSDVRTLQTALAALGFSCATDGIFGAHTERAVREFQHNAGIGGDGIVGDSTFSAIERLRHAWEGKDQLASVPRPLGFARAAEVLESTPISIYGADDVARGVAERISNLAMATTAASLVVNISSFESLEPPKSLEPFEQLTEDSVLIIQLVCASTASDGQPSASRKPKSAKRDSVPQVVYDSDLTINARMATAIGLAAGRQSRITVLLVCASREGESLSAREEQHAAIALLDALCLAFG
jgi:peptidoglycan hydrolase-like protein with peptidoglycan-binding domain